LVFNTEVGGQSTCFVLYENHGGAVSRFDFII